MVTLLSLLFVCVSYAEFSCEEPYYFSPLSTMESSFTLMSTHLSNHTVDCDEQTSKLGSWVKIVNSYEHQLTFQIKASEEIEMQYYMACNEHCVKSADEVFLVLSPGHEQYIFVSFKTPYNTVFFYPVNTGTKETPIIVQPPYPVTIRSTLKGENDTYTTVMKLRIGKQWKMGVNISTVTPIRSTIENTNINYTQTFTTSYFEFTSPSENTELFVTFASGEITVIEVTFSLVNYIPVGVMDTIDIYPYFRYETVPTETLPNDKNLRGFSYELKAQESKMYILDLCSTVDNDLDIYTEHTYTKSACPNGKKGTLIQFDSQSTESIRLSVGFTKESPRARAYLLNITQVDTGSNPLNEDSNVKYIIIVVALLIAVIILSVGTVGVGIVWWRFKKTEYTTI